MVEESGPHPSRPRPDGWAPHDQRATGSVWRHHGQHTPLVAALTPAGWQAPWPIEGAGDTASVTASVTASDTAAGTRSVTEGRGPMVRPGQMGMLDHLRVHTASRIRDAIAAFHCAGRFLLPSSPDLTPIAPAFSQIQARSRSLGARTGEALHEALRLAVSASTHDDAAAGCAHAGYALPDQEA